MSYVLPECPETTSGAIAFAPFSVKIHVTQLPDLSEIAPDMGRTNSIDEAFVWQSELDVLGYEAEVVDRNGSQVVKPKDWLANSVFAYN